MTEPTLIGAVCTLVLSASILAQVRDYRVLDASIIGIPGPLASLFRIDNIFDEEYAESGFIERTGHFPGEPRTVFLEMIKR